MNIENESVERLLLIGIKSEIAAGNAYTSLAKQVNNPFLKMELETLAREEEKHREVLENLFRKLFPDKEMSMEDIDVEELPEFPQPKIFMELGKITDWRKILEEAMRAERSARDYYNSIAEKFEDKKIKSLMRYMARIEEGHYMILKKQYDDFEEFENLMGDENYVQFDARY